MQTFLPLKSFAASAAVLDWRRLGKQRVECRQLLRALRHDLREGELVTIPQIGGWNNHPAAKMWRGYEETLALYYQNMVIEWMRRGYTHNMGFYIPEDDKEYVYPSWFGDEAFHASHRSNLLRKDPQYYGQFGWTEGPDLPYVWPVP